MKRILSAIAVALSLFTALVAFAAPVGTSWTYQGQLRREGLAYNGPCNFQFSLWDAASAGAQQGATHSINGVSVVNGLFTVLLDFGSTPLQGEARWLSTAVQCGGDAAFTPLDPRQPITSVPYALSLRPGARIENSSDFGRGIQGILTSPAAHSSSIAVFADNRGHGWGVYGTSQEGYGIEGVSPYVGVRGSSNAGIGVWGSGLGEAGVKGTTPNQTGSGVYGSATGTNAAGVFGLNSSGPGIWGRSTGGGSAVYGENTGGGFAGRFIGPVSVEGHLTKFSGTFKIDHPLDPANKFLSHSFVESPDMMNIYNGNVTTDAAGSATVTLPTYFAALNRDFRYQLTVLGQFAQAIVSRKIAQNSFEIRTDKPNVEVSWQVTGIRQDPYAEANRVRVEEAKPPEQQGTYLYPEGYGQPSTLRGSLLQRPNDSTPEQHAPAGN